jgi:DNA-binding CsgD family transcriptional regulator
MTHPKPKRYYLTGKYKNYYLTKREAECLICLARGYTLKQIGRTLGVSPRTIEDHIERLKGKLRCRSRSDLINIAIECDFLEGVRPHFRET